MMMAYIKHRFMYGLDKCDTELATSHDDKLKFDSHIIRLCRQSSALVLTTKNAMVKVQWDAGNVTHPPMYS